MDETTSDKSVDNGERVGDEVEDEVVSIARGRSKDDDNANDPVLEETGQRSVERSVASPETGERQNTLATKLLNKATLREDNTQDVAESRKGDKDRHGALGSRTHDVAEERSSDKTLRGNDLGLGNSGEVSDVDEDVNNGDRNDGGRSGDLESAHRVASLAESIVGVAVTDETPNYVVQSSDNTVGAASGTLESAAQVVGLLIDLEVTAESDETADDHDEDDGQLDEAKGVLEAKTPLESAAVDEESSRDASQTNSTLVPSVDLLVGGVEDVLAKDDRVTGCPTHEQNVGSVDAGGEELGLAVDELEVVLLTTVLGDTGSPFEVDGSTSSGDEGTNDPNDEGQTGTSKKGKDGARSRKDTGTDDSVEDEHRCAQNTNLALGVGSMLKTTLFCVRASARANIVGLVGFGFKTLEIVVTHDDKTVNLAV